MLTTKAFGYLRVSTAEQVLGDGFQRQRDAITRFCSLNNIEIVRWYEEDIHGTIQPLDRPVFGLMLAELDGVATIVCESYGRCSRNADELAMMLAVFERRGFRLLSATEPNEDKSDPVSTAMRQILAAFHQLDRALIRKRTSERIKAKLANDPTFRLGRLPYGRKNGEAEVLARIVEWSQAGNSTGMIADKLNGLKIPTRGGQPWKAGTITGIVRRSKKS